MIFAFERKKEVFTLKEFMSLPAQTTQSKTPQDKYTPMFSFMGINVTHHTFFSMAYSGAYWVVFGVAGVAFLSTFLEYYYRAKGLDNRADSIKTFTELMFPIAFYLFLYFGIVTVF